MAERLPKKRISRRQTLQLSSGILALGAGLGVALTTTAARGGTAQLQFKFFKVTEKTAKLMHTFEVPAAVAEQLTAGAVRQLNVKWYRATESGEQEYLGAYKLPETLQGKIHKT